MMSDVATSVPSLSSSSPRLRTRRWIARIGLPSSLVIVVVTSAIYIRGVVINERYVRWPNDYYYLSTENGELPLDAPGLSESNNTHEPMPDKVIVTVNSTTILPVSGTHSKNRTVNPVRPKLDVNIQNGDQSHGEVLANQTEEGNKLPLEDLAEDESQNGDNGDHEDTTQQSNHSLEDLIPPTNDTTRITSATYDAIALWKRSNSTRPNRTILPFEKQEGVVIVSKIHGPHQVHILTQALCLLHFAYNRRPKYDIVVFTTIPLLAESIDSIQKMVHPVNITFVVDNRGLQEEIAALSPLRYQNFLQACQVDTPSNLTWWSECPGRIAYNWQAEFRAWHIWKHPALAAYKWMMWLDSDAFCTQKWAVDPIQVMIENDLVILFDNWPEGHHAGQDVNQRIWKAFGVYLCSLRLSEGHFYSKVRNTTCRGSQVGDIHGFFHITNMEFYRSDIVQKWAETWIGDGFLQRRYDDQCAVTIPAAILAPERAWDMRRNKIHLDVFHNFKMDGKKKQVVGGFKKFWRKNATARFPDAVHVCSITAAG